MKNGFSLGLGRRRIAACWQSTTWNKWIMVSMMMLGSTIIDIESFRRPWSHTNAQPDKMFHFNTISIGAEPATDSAWRTQTDWMTQSTIEQPTSRSPVLGTTLGRVANTRSHRRREERRVSPLVRAQIRLAIQQRIRDLDLTCQHSPKKTFQFKFNEF